MLRTLFGELAPLGLSRTRQDPDPDEIDTVPADLHDTEAGALVSPLTVAAAQPTSATEVVVVDASPAAAIRAHFAASRADLDQASAMITLLDPSKLWASEVIQALADAGQEPLERVSLRERGTLRTLAMIERTRVPRQQAAPLKVYHADIRATGLEQEEIANALAEGSQLTAVILGALPPHAVVALLRSILAATRQPEWRCPWLVFILPPGAAALRQRILDQDWPAHVRTAAMAESLGSAASVWNAVLTAWEAAAAERKHDASLTAAATTDLAADGLGPLLAQGVGRALGLIARTEGLLACGLVSLSSGELLEDELRGDSSRDALAAQAAALCAARQACAAALAGAAAPPEGPGELLAMMGGQQVLLHPLPQGSAFGLVAVLERSQANLPLLRFRLREAEKHLI
jgi:hypothetical protein